MILHDFNDGVRLPEWQCLKCGVAFEGKVEDLDDSVPELKCPLGCDGVFVDSLWFDERPKRIAPCPRCCGDGTITDHYALCATSYVKDAPSDVITAVVIGASSIFEACKEAAEIAGRAHRPVAFDFNGQCIVVQPGDNPNAVARQWWTAEYGYTPEESAVR